MRFVAAILGLLAVAGAATAQSTEPASVRGSVVRADGSAAADIEVRLEVLDTERVVLQRQGRTDAGGTVLWDDLQVPGPSLARLAADYDGATYMSDALPLSPGEEIVLLTTVAEVTSEGRPLHLDTLHVIVQAEEPGIYGVLQFMTVTNAGGAAWAGGPQMADGRNAGLVVPLPATARNVRPAPFPTASDSLPAGAMQIEADRVLDPRPVPPGGRQVAVTYDLVGDGDTVAVALLIPYPAQSVSVLLGGPAAQGVEIRDSNLSRQQPQQVGEQEYELWTADAMPPDTEVRFTLARAGSGMSTPALALIALGIALVLAAAASLRGDAAPVDAESRLQEVVRDLAGIDAAHDEGTMETSEYFSRRAAALEEALMLQEALGRAHGAPVEAAGD